jgi:[citrate (pro-3S)-lyase] ligase
MQWSLSSFYKPSSREAEVLGYMSRFDDVSADFIHGVSVVAAIGGSVFDYFLDKGVKKVCIYGNDELVSVLCEQAFWKGVEIEGAYGNADNKLSLNYYERSAVTSISIKGIANVEKEIRTPIILCDTPLRRMHRAYRLKDLIEYSVVKRVLFDPVLAYKKQYAPRLQLVAFALPSLWHTRNRNEHENLLLQHQDQKACLRSQIHALQSLGKDEEYIKQACRRFEAYEQGEVTLLKDASAPYHNTQGGHRVTDSIPENPCHTIYTFGHSICTGFICDDANTIQSSLQRALNKQYDDKSPYSVLNCGNGGHRNYEGQRKLFEHLKPQNGDIAVFISWFSALLRENYTDYFHWCAPQTDARLFDRPHDLGEHIWTDQAHYSYIGYRELGNYLARDLIAHGVVAPLSQISGATVSASQTEYAATAESARLEDEKESEQLAAYLRSAQTHRARIGAIVMNCNPFTLGHRYLIEYAASQCDRLFVFAVEEDLSFFPFADRIELIREGTADLSNVTVLPSGNFIISRTTFPLYFEKEALQEDVVIDASSDVETFASKIAPALGITVRFAGEEPLDNVTRQYNAQMRRILPQYGVEFAVIPRKELSGEPISASWVRRLLEEGEFDGIKSLVPQTTFDYLQSRFAGKPI